MKSIKKLLKTDFFKILVIFLIWRVSLVIFLILAINFLPLGFKDRFLGGGFTNYSNAPHIFSWANYDGEHYLSISIFGYKQLEQAFFPVYPGIISQLAKIFSTDYYSLQINSVLIGLLISNISFLMALYFLYKLIKLDYSEKVALFSTLSLVVFPVSFYFGSMYNESLYLLLSILSFYLFRKKRLLGSGIFGLIASATRVFGVLIFISLLAETWKKKINYNFFWLFLIPLGLILYMFYQWKEFGSPFVFYNLQTIIGEQHQTGITLLPQVLFRYIKIIFSIDPQSSIYQTILLEFFTAILYIFLIIYSFFAKMRPSYLIYSTLGFLIPSSQGSFSSSPRYGIVFFPMFICLGLILTKIPTWSRLLILTVFFVLLGIETSLFLRGYWVS